VQLGDLVATEEIYVLFITLMSVVEAECCAFYNSRLLVCDEHIQQYLSCPSDISDTKEQIICIKFCFNFQKSSF